jgi:ATP-dependent exoDNAse (exonuclease V) alpha subunit
LFSIIIPIAFQYKKNLYFVVTLKNMIQTAQNFYKFLIQKFPHQTTILQDNMLASFSDFIFNTNIHALYLLKGYAGTGKTTVISTIVNHLESTGKKAVLLAPTGRAAKVLAQYADKEAFTIHKKIYHSKRNKSGGVSFELKKNTYTQTLFFVDEASMISDQSEDLSVFKNNSVLADLIKFVYGGTGCKLVFIGDTAQLPPVKSIVSPALDLDKLTLEYSKEITEIELTEVMRQEKTSGILDNATALREKINEMSTDDFLFNLHNPDTIRLIDGYEIQDAIFQSYGNESIEDTAIIVWANKRANQYNEQIRTRIMGKEGDISSGDYVMVVKNNYYWLDDTSEAGFIANGDTCQILSIRNRVELYGFKFAEATVKLVDYPRQQAFDVVLLLDTLTVNAPALTYEDGLKLYNEIAKDYAHLNTKYKIYQSVKEDKYYNALQVKFSYAITCHKSQGGQWKNVFIEKPYLPNGQNMEYWRWLYTAITRAQEKLYLIGFTDADFIK